jgi:predicted nucleotidyltransferase
MDPAWDSDIMGFLKCCTRHSVRMILVGGGAVNFHGYQRHSADVDFWVDMSDANVEALSSALMDLGFERPTFPLAVLNRTQNISLKFSPASPEVELITHYSSVLDFEDAWARSEVVEIHGSNVMKWNVLSLEDLIVTKVKAGRPKDLLDVQELQRLRSEPS